MKLVVSWHLRSNLRHNAVPHRFCLFMSKSPGMNDRQESRMVNPHVDGPCASVPLTEAYARVISPPSWVVSLTLPFNNIPSVLT